eukprot:gb/GEZN01018531.1/.p1 GENE.gb/GEZN01018531.1/~~gb/GEZN01018531.1/.p1  ORF type:complete len:168 (+),score=37.77 gb/GEZN01018531.1/:23-526(+)
MPQGKLKIYSAGGAAKKGAKSAKAQSKSNKTKMKKGRMKIKPKSGAKCLQAKVDRKITGAITKNIEMLMATRAAKGGGGLKLIKPEIDESLLSKSKGPRFGDKASKDLHNARKRRVKEERKILESALGKKKRKFGPASEKKTGPASEKKTDSAGPAPSAPSSASGSA